MTATTVLCVTPLESDPLLPGAAQLHERQAQLRALVRRRLGDRHADLLAEPQKRDGALVAWLTSVGGLVRPFGTLPAVIRASVRTECDTLLAEIARLGQTLADAGTGDARLAGDLLRRAAYRVGDDHLFLVGNQVVLANWGAASADVTTSTTSATTARRGAPVPPLVARWLIPARAPA